MCLTGFLRSVIDARETEARGHIEEYPRERVEIEVDNNVPESHELVDESLELVAEASVAPEPDLDTHGLTIEAFNVGIFTELV